MKKKIESIINLLEITLGGMPTEDADAIVEVAIALLKSLSNTK